MQICVCGWHYYPRFYETLSTIRINYDIVIIAHRAGYTSELPYITRENAGLEWGAYSYFLDYHWDKLSNVLFMHDDTEVNLDFFNEIASISNDLTFVFENERDFQTMNTHGRVFIASARFLTAVQSQEGIWYDKGNKGFITDSVRTDKPPTGCQDHNAGIRAFTVQAERIVNLYPSFSVNKPFFSDHIKYGIRGKIKKDETHSRI